MRIQACAAGCRFRERRAAGAFLALLALGLAWPLPAAAAPKTDVVVLVNGDRLTCEIKSLEHNRLKVSTDHMGTVYIEWDKIARLQSSQYLLLERSDGVRYYGQLKPGTEDGRLQIDRGDTRSTPENVAMAAVVRAQPIEGGAFIDRLDGYVSAGLDLSQSGDRTSLDFAGGLSSKTRIREWSIDAASNVTNDRADTTERYDLSGFVRRRLQTRNFYEGQLGFANNSELDLDLRSQLGGVFGRYFRQSNRGEWLGGIGLAYTTESYVGEDTVDSVELVLGTEFSIFRYDFPETDIGGSLVVLPSLTESGRYRSEAELRAKYEFIDDLYFELRMYGSYDSKPPGDGDAQSDYGFVTSLGYSF
jgi:hypothetical protein